MSKITFSGEAGDTWLTMMEAMCGRYGADVGYTVKIQRTGETVPTYYGIIGISQDAPFTEGNQTYETQGVIVKKWDNNVGGVTGEPITISMWDIIELEVL
jgi:hypothetical protein